MAELTPKLMAAESSVLLPPDVPPLPPWLALTLFEVQVSLPWIALVFLRLSKKPQKPEISVVEVTVTAPLMSLSLGISTLLIKKSETRLSRNGHE